MSEDLVPLTPPLVPAGVLTPPEEDYVQEAGDQPTREDPPIQVFRAGRWMVVSQ